MEVLGKKVEQDNCFLLSILIPQDEGIGGIWYYQSLPLFLVFLRKREKAGGAISKNGRKGLWKKRKSKLTNTCCHGFHSRHLQVESEKNDLVIHFHTRQFVQQSVNVAENSQFVYLVVRCKKRELIINYFLHKKDELSDCCANKRNLGYYQSCSICVRSGERSLRKKSGKLTITCYGFSQQTSHERK